MFAFGNYVGNRFIARIFENKEQSFIISGMTLSAGQTSTDQHVIVTALMGYLGFAVWFSLCLMYNYRMENQCKSNFY